MGKEEARFYLPCPELSEPSPVDFPTASAAACATRCSASFASATVPDAPTTSAAARAALNPPPVRGAFVVVGSTGQAGARRPAFTRKESTGERHAGTAKEKAAAGAGEETATSTKTRVQTPGPRCLDTGAHEFGDRKEGSGPGRDILPRVEDRCERWAAG